MRPVHEQIDGGEEYLGWARQKLAVLERSRQELGVPKLAKYLYPDDCVEVYIVASEDVPLIRIVANVSGFICHPRDNTNPGGAKPSGVAITPVYQYPLVDDDHGSRILSWEDDWAVSDMPENYGNLDWLGIDGNAISWRGPAGRQIPMVSSLSFPGFTIFDYVDDNDVNHYTPFRNLIYQNGDVIKIFPAGQKVLGCGLAGGMLVCVVNVDYSGVSNPDGGIGGFYDEVYAGDNRIGWQAASRPSVPWFFSATGLEAVCGNRKMTIAGDLESVSFETLTMGSGTETNHYNGNNQWAFSRAGSWPMYRDYMLSAINSIALTVAMTEVTGKSGDSDAIYDDLPIMISGTPPDTLTVSGTETPTVGAQYSYSITGGEGFVPCDEYVIQWSFDGGTINDSGVITAITGCGSATVTAKLIGGGFELTGSKVVRLPNGQWINDGYEYGPDNSTRYGYDYHVVTSGQYEYTWMSGVDSNLITTYFDTYLPTDSYPSCPGCRLVVGVGRDYSKGSGLDYPYRNPNYAEGYPQNCCCPGCRDGTSVWFYSKTYAITRRKWVCP